MFVIVSVACYCHPRFGGGGLVWFGCLLDDVIVVLRVVVWCGVSLLFSFVCVCVVVYSVVLCVVLVCVLFCACRCLFPFVVLSRVVCFVFVALVLRT